MQVNSPWDTQADAPLDTEFTGHRWRLFWMALRLGVLTVLTLGFYRFWMKTRLRRWYWSAFRPGGHPLEYVGDPWEKLLGFLIAVVFLAFYIGIVNLLLMFASFSLFNGSGVAYFLSFIGVIPLWFYATYRARRYVLARSRWRGIRFGLAPGAWGYALTALWHWFLTIVSLGLLWPRKSFYLEKYITDRTYYGAQPMEQTGRWTALLGPWMLVWLPIGVLLVTVGLSFALSPNLSLDMLFTDEDSGALDGVLAVLGIGVFVLPFWLPLTLLNYSVKRLKYLTSTKVLGTARLSMAPRFWRVFGVYFWGYVLAGLVSGIVLAPIVAIAITTAVRFGADLGVDLGALATASQAALTALGVASYFLLFLMWSALTHAFIRFPLFRHYAETLQVHDPRGIDQITQRARDEFGEAEGFAEALDVGAAI